MVVNKNDITPGGQPGPGHVGWSHSGKTFNGSHPLDVFVQRPILNVWKGFKCQRHCQFSEKWSHEHSVLV